MENEKLRFSRPIWLRTILSFRRNNQVTLLPYHGAAGAKVVPSYIITSYLAGDYFQALRHFISIDANGLIRFNNLC